MFLLTRPTTAEIDTFLEKRADDRYSYPELGATRGVPPSGYNLDHNRAAIGNGRADFERAKAAVLGWKMFDILGLELYYPDTPIEKGRTVALLAWHLGFYSMNSCRIVYVIDDANRFGFAYGTLTAHVEIGEERFTVELDPETGQVWYEILAFSRPGHILVKLGYPYGRYRQKQFALASMAAMRHAVSVSRG